LSCAQRRTYADKHKLFFSDAFALFGSLLVLIQLLHAHLLLAHLLFAKSKSIDDSINKCIRLILFDDDALYLLLSKSIHANSHVRL
jgi:hypothetical protein